MQPSAEFSKFRKGKEAMWIDNSELMFCGGRYWDWTSDPYNVNVVLSRWANRPTHKKNVYDKKKK